MASTTILFCFLCATALVLQAGVSGRILTLATGVKLQQGGTGSMGVVKKNVGTRSKIGSVMPTCTVNECRGCKYSCRAEQVPVEGNDPISSAYRYRCICHR